MSSDMVKREAPFRGSPRSRIAASKPEANIIDSLKKALFIIGSCLIVFAAARNSVTWHVQQFWGASHDFWQTQWIRICGFFMNDWYLINIVGTFVVTMVPFWTFNLLLILLDTTNKPTVLMSYKVQPDQNYPVNPDRLKSAVRRVLFNQTVVGLPVLFISAYMLKLRGCTVSHELPTFHWTLFEILIFVLVEEVGFYYSHRLMHTPRFYKMIHKTHHEWTAPIGIISLYAHPIEHVASNLLPPFLGPFIMGSHIATAWMWYVLALLSTSVAHGGYHFPFFPSPEAHDFHHLKFVNNFGVLGVLDRLHGTDNLFRASKQYDRHIMLLSLTPIRQLFPDDQGKK